jgi:SAM-dependent methyltransferase
LGCVDSVRVGDVGVEVRGWLKPLENVRVTGVVVELDRRVCESRSCRLGVARSGCDVWRFSAGERGDFRITVPLRDCARGGVRDALLEVTPWFGARRGFSVFGVAEPSLRLPSSVDQRAFGEDFLGMAYRLLGHCVNYAGLEPDDRVLDVGCGAGRLAYALTAYLAPAGAYEGFDANARWIRSAEGAIATRFPNFAFRPADVRHPVYNRAGTAEASRLVFPYAEESFDLVCAISVFQHNRPDAVRRLLREVARVLRPGGRCLITCFLLGPRRQEQDKRADSLNFLHPLDGSWCANPALPEIGIAHEQAAVEEWSRRVGLCVQSVREGEWRGGERVLSYQDVVVLEKPGSACPSTARV